MPRTLLCVALLVLTDVALCSHTRANEAEDERPNIVLIMTDDQGYGDLGVTDNPVIRTPRLDALARQSATVRRFYVSPVCAPTRASLMTGRYNYRTGVVDTYLGRAMMHSDEVTLAEMLRGAGYRTGIFGKWHLGDTYPLRPQDQGFDEVLVHTGGGLCQPSGPPDNSYFDPSLLHNGERIQTEGYCSDVYVDYLLEFLDKNQDRPFFIYLPFNCPHGPYQVPDEYKKPYDEMNLEPDDFPQMGNARPNVPDNTEAVYGMVENVDDNVGRILDRLDQLELADNTIVIFLTDNGPNGMRYNHGLRRCKGSVYEGGIRTVFFVRWPDRLRPGHRVDQIAGHIDVVPTLLEACNVDVPDGVDLDGRSLLPLLEGKSPTWPDRTLYLQWHRGDAPDRYRAFAAVGQHWKLVRGSAAPIEGELANSDFELFAIDDDPYELNDVGTQHSAIVQKMRDAYDTWFDDVATDHGYGPVRIYLGSEHENPVILTRQDWRGPQASWGARGLGFWEVKVARGGRYRIRCEADGPKKPARAVLQIQGQKHEIDIDPGTGEYTFPIVTLEASDAERLETWIDEEGQDEPYGVRYVYVERLAP